MTFACSHVLVMLRSVDRQSRDFHYKMAFELLCAFYSIPELKISEDFSVEQTILYVMSRLTGSHQLNFVRHIEN